MNNKNKNNNTMKEQKIKGIVWTIEFYSTDEGMFVKKYANDNGIPFEDKKITTQKEYDDALEVFRIMEYFANDDNFPNEDLEEDD